MCCTFFDSNDGRDQTGYCSIPSLVSKAEPSDLVAAGPTRLNLMALQFADV